MGNPIILKDVRLSFSNIFSPQAPMKNSPPGTPPKYGAHFIMAPDSDAFKAAHAEFVRVAQEKWGPNWQAIVGAIEGSKKCIRTGNKHIDKAGVVREGYADMMYVVARNKARPAVVAARTLNGKFIDVSEDSRAFQNGVPLQGVPFPVKAPYGGCRVNAKIEIYVSENNGRSINASLMAVQFAADDKAFSGGPGTADGFEDQGGDEGESGMPTGEGAAAGSLFG